MQVGSAEITRLLGIHAHIGPSLQRGGPQLLGLFFFTGLDHLQLADQSLGITGTSGSRTVQFQCRCSFYGRTSLGALLSMMMNVALKSELVVESWA